jgi:hypothetical protein
VSNFEIANLSIGYRVRIIDNIDFYVPLCIYKLCYSLRIIDSNGLFCLVFSHPNNPILPTAADKIPHGPIHILLFVSRLSWKPLIYDGIPLI